MMRTDVLVVGSGIAGLAFAIRLAETLPGIDIAVIAKSEVCNTALAQGGIAVVTDLENDSFARHEQDTMDAGGGFSDPEVVRMVVQEAPERLQELLRWGVVFDRDADGAYNLHKEGGHSARRILHKLDCTGKEIEEKLLQRLSAFKHVRLHRHLLAVDLLSLHTDAQDSCRSVFSGMRVYDPERNCSWPFFARFCLIASGGCAALYSNSTNPPEATGDGVAIALRAGIPLRDMRFMQFHPTALQVPGKQEGLFLITEALRGFGAHMVNAEGKRFLFKSDMRGELATRDVLTAAIRSELRLSVGKQVYLDCRHLDPALLRLHFPSVCTALDQLKIDLSRHLIPVVPAAHYQCGGIVSGLKGETAMRHLYAAGECAYTGLHGRNRLASNSLLEALVFANRAATDVLERIGDAGLSTVSFAETRSHNPPDMETLYLLKDLASQLRQWVDLAGVPCQESPALNFEIPDRIAAITAELLNAGFLSREILQMRNMAAVARAIASDVQKHEQNHVDLASV